MPNAIIMAGGTGGHIFPALAVADELREQGWQIIWLGTADRLEAKVVPQNGFTIQFLPVRGIRGKGITNRLAGVWGVLKSIVTSFKTIRAHKADVVVGFGGYPSFPGGIAAKLLGKPLLIHEQNAVPGLTNKLLSRIASDIFVGFPLAKELFEAKGRPAKLVGNPIRKDIEYKQKGPHDGPFRLLILGGSLGARPLNQQVPVSVKGIENLDILHQCGTGNEDAVLSLYQENTTQCTVRVQAFIDDMAQTYHWADAVICRAGALTVSEISKAGLAACFVPLPHAVDDHQTKNAQYLQQEDAAVLIAQSNLAEKLAPILKLWVSDPEVCRKMGAKASQSLPTHATEQIVAACKQYLKESTCPQN